MKSSQQELSSPIKLQHLSKSTVKHLKCSSKSTKQIYSDAILQEERNNSDLDAHQCPSALEPTLNTVDTASLWEKCKADS